MKHYYTNAELAIIDEGELNRHFNKVKNAIYKNRVSKKSNKRLEMYYCYVSREVQLRQQRREFGKKYEQEKRKNGK